MTREQIENTFKHHELFGDQIERYEQIREQARMLAVTILQYCPESPQKSLAFTALQQAMMWANASIAINENQS